MASDDTVHLGEWPLPYVRLHCPKCERQGDYPTVALMERFGDEIDLPELRLRLAEEGPGCPYIDLPDGREQCGAMFPDAMLVAAILQPERDWPAEVAAEAAEWRERLGLGT